MNRPTIYKFSGTDRGVAVEAVYDLGWSEKNLYGGKGAYEYVAEFVDGIVILILRAFGDPTDTVTVTLNSDRLFFDMFLSISSSVFSCRMEKGVIIVETDAQVMIEVQQGIINVSRGY
jgi:hypothetical protein